MKQDVRESLSTKDIEQADVASLDEWAAGMATVADNAPERQAFLRRAERNPVCMQRLHQGERLMRLLDAVPTPPRPSTEVMQRVRAQIAAELHHEMRPWWAAGAAALATAVAWLSALWATNHMLDGRALISSVVIVGALSVVAVVMSRYSVITLTVAFLASLSAPLFLPSVASSQIAATLVGCTLVEFVTAAAPLAIVSFSIVRGHRIVSSPLSFAGVAAIGALAGQLALHAACPNVNPAHIYPWHVGGVFFAAALGWATAHLPALRPHLSQS